MAIREKEKAELVAMSDLLRNIAGGTTAGLIVAITASTEWNIAFTDGEIAFSLITILCLAIISQVLVNLAHS